METHLKKTQLFRDSQVFRHSLVGSVVESLYVPFIVEVKGLFSCL